jgi:outer membrane biosynthesis protein TonB
VTVAFDAFLGAARTRRPRAGRWRALAAAVLLHAGLLAALVVRHAPTHATRPVLSVPVVFRPAPLALPAPPRPKDEPPPALAAAPAPRPRNARRAPPPPRREPRPTQPTQPTIDQRPPPSDTKLAQTAPATAPPAAAPATGAERTPPPAPAADTAASTATSAAGSGAPGGNGARPARFLPEALANLHKLAGAAPEFPASLAQAGSVYVVEARICVAPAGHVQSVNLLKGAHPVLDGNVRRTVMTWRYRPLLAGGVAIPFCTLARFEFKGL